MATGGCCRRSRPAVACGHDASHPHRGRAGPRPSADILFAAGWFGVYPDVPSDLGAEGVGRVVQVGAGVDQGLVGRRVLILPTFTYGTWAQETAVPPVG